VGQGEAVDHSTWERVRGLVGALGALGLQLLDDSLSPRSFVAAMHAGLAQCADLVWPSTGLADWREPSPDAALSEAFDVVDTDLRLLRAWLVRHAAVTPGRALPCH